MIEVNTLWIGERFSQLERLAALSHIKQGHRYILWSYAPILNVPNQVIIKDAREILPETDIWAYQVGEGKGSYSACSNLFRYKFLLDRGGWWVDADVVCIKPFNFDQPYIFASERIRNGSSTPTTCVMKAPANSVFARSCWVVASTIDRNNIGWGTIGPKLLTMAVFEHDLEPWVVPVNTFCPTNWFDAEIDPVNPICPDLSNSYAIHLWHEMWRRKGIDKDGEYPQDSLYEKLKHAIL